jgi:hypothetical protein
MQLICGMHRSGTSLVARLFYESGANMGNPDNFHPPDKWNPDGYFEHKDILEINMYLVNGYFWKFSYFMLPKTEKLIKRSYKISEKIKKKSLKYNECVIKENRFCLTLPAWIENHTNFEKIIICLREPYEVAVSLKKRNHIPLKLGYHLWNIHNQRILEHTKYMDVFFIKYSDLLDVNGFIQNMSFAFSFFKMKVDNDSIEKLFKKCVRSNKNNKQIDDLYPEHISFLWNELKERHEKQFI